LLGSVKNSQNFFRLFQFKFIGIFSVTLIFSGASLAAEDSALRILKLNSILQNLKAIRQALHVRDEGRIFVIEETVRKLKEVMEQENAGSFEIMRWQQLLFSKMRVSKPFFEFIRTLRTQNAIHDLLETYLEIRRKTKYDTAKSEDVFAHFTQLQTVIDRFRENDTIGSKLRERLGRISRLLSSGIAAATVNGDGHERTNNYVRAVYEQVKPLYNDLFSYLGVHPLDEWYQEIVGVNEILGSFLEEKSVAALSLEPRK
jgi:hypothetical protein